MGLRMQYKKDVTHQRTNAQPHDPRVGRIHARLALLRARILKKNLTSEQGDPRRNFISEDWEGADCQVYLNDPEDEDSQAGCENLFEAEYEWLSNNNHLAAAKDVIVTGPTCLS